MLSDISLFLNSMQGSDMFKGKLTKKVVFCKAIRFGRPVLTLGKRDWQNYDIVL